MHWETTDQPLEVASELVAHALSAGGESPRLAIAQIPHLTVVTDQDLT